jgi:hypothetical protein
VLEGLLRELGRDAQADEVAAKWKAFPFARLGGPAGPPLSASTIPDSFD